MRGRAGPGHEGSRCRGLSAGSRSLDPVQEAGHELFFQKHWGLSIPTLQPGLQRSDVLSDEMSSPEKLASHPPAIEISGNIPMESDARGVMPSALAPAERPGCCCGFVHSESWSGSGSHKLGTNPSAKSSSQRHPEVRPSAPGGFLTHVLCVPGDPRASRSQPGRWQRCGRAAHEDSSPACSALPSSRAITARRCLG